MAWKPMLKSLAASSFLFVSTSASAHHGDAAYELKKVTVKATVTAWVWSNPHTILKFDVKDDKGSVVHWLAEWDAPSTLVNPREPSRSYSGSGL